MLLAALLTQLVLAPNDTPPSLGLVESWWTVRRAPKWEDYRGKVLIVHTYPSYCCGWDESVKLVRQTLDRWPGKVAAISINYGSLSKTVHEREEGLKALKGVKINWPCGVDSDDKFMSKLFPGEATRWTYIFFDRQGRRVDVPMSAMTDLPQIVGDLVKRS